MTPSSSSESSDSFVSFSPVSVRESKLLGSNTRPNAFSINVLIGSIGDVVPNRRRFEGWFGSGSFSSMSGLHSGIPERGLTLPTLCLSFPSVFPNRAKAGGEGGESEVVLSNLEISKLLVS